MASRLKLHEELCTILGTRNVYYQPPESVKLKYPAIVYSRKSIDTRHANDVVYKRDNAYELTFIASDPESEVIDKLLMLRTCRFDRSFTSDNLNHTTFTLYY